MYLTRLKKHEYNLTELCFYITNHSNKNNQSIVIVKNIVDLSELGIITILILEGSLDFHPPEVVSR